MSGHSSLIGFAEAVVRAMTHAGQPALLTQSLQEAWHLFRHLSSEDLAVELLMEGNALYVRHEGQSKLEINTQLEPGERDRTHRMVTALFARGQIRQLTFLPGLSWKELGTAIPLVVGGGEQARFKLCQHHVYRVQCLGARPVLQIDRSVPLVVAENLDMFYVAIQGVNRFGAGQGDTPRDILTRSARYLLGRIGTQGEARAFLACLDLPMRNLPQSLQQNALKMMVDALRPAWRGELLLACERIVAMAGGPQALGNKTDPNGIPLVGYYIVSRVLREMVAAEQRAPAADGSGWGRFGGGSPIENEDSLRQKSQPMPHSGLREQSSQGSGRPPSLRANTASGMPGAGNLRANSQSLRSNAQGLRNAGTGGNGRHNTQPRVGASATSRSGGGSGLHRIQRTSGSGVLRSQGGASRDGGSGLIKLRRTQGSGLHSTGNTEASGLIRLARTSSQQRTTDSGAFGLTGRDRSDPSSVQRALDPRVDSWVASFEKVGKRLLDKAQKVDDPESYIGAIKIVSNVGGFLLDEERWATALPIVRLLKLQQKQAEHWPEQQRQALTEALGLVLPAEGVDAMAASLPDADFLDRVGLLELIAYYGAQAAPALIQLATTRRLTGTLKKEVAACVEALGVEAGPALVDAINKHGRKWNRVAPLIAMLGAVGFRGGQRRVLEFLRHPQPKLREEALVAVYKMLGDKSQRYLLHALDDGDAGVCQKAVALLAAAGAKEAAFTSLIADLIDIDSPEDAREEGLIITAVEGLRDLGNVRLNEKTTAESALISALKETWGGGLLGRIGSKTGRSPGVLAAICGTLGEIGSDKARSVLQTVPRDAAAAIRQAADAAVAQIGARAAR